VNNELPSLVFFAMLGFIFLKEIPRNNRIKFCEDKIIFFEFTNVLAILKSRAGFPA